MALRASRLKLTSTFCERAAASGSPMWALAIASGHRHTTYLGAALAGDPFADTPTNRQRFTQLASALGFDGEVFEEVER
jgi:hypothetical protein